MVLDLCHLWKLFRTSNQCLSCLCNVFLIGNSYNSLWNGAVMLGPMGKSWWWYLTQTTRRGQPSARRLVGHNHKPVECFPSIFLSLFSGPAQIRSDRVAYQGRAVGGGRVYGLISRSEKHGVGGRRHAGRHQTHSHLPLPQIYTTNIFYAFPC